MNIATTSGSKTPRNLALGVAVLLAAGVVYFWILAPQPPCASCHVEQRDNLTAAPDGRQPAAGKTCFINGRIRNDWGVTFGGPVFARFGAVEISGASGHGAGECVNIPIACPAAGAPMPELVFHNAGGDQLWSNPLCPDCRHCE